MISKSRLKNILALKFKKYRVEQNLFLIEGFRLCQEALESDFAIETLLVNRELLSHSKLDAIIQLARNKNIEVVDIQQSEVRRLADTVNSQGIFCVVRQKRFAPAAILNNKNKIIVIIDEGQDPGNVGTIIRTCDWFGVDAVLLSEGTVELYNPKVVRSTMGSIFHLPIAEAVDLSATLSHLKQLGYHIFGADPKGEFYYHQVDYLFPIALVIGNENRGINAELSSFIDKTIKIPSYGKAESLNMALAAAIIISRIVN